MKLPLIAALFTCSCLFYNNLLSQNIGIGTSQPHPSALLDLQSNSKGLLIPRMSMNNRQQIQNPVAGLMLYQTDSTKGLYYFDGSLWQKVTSQQSGIGKMIFINATDNDGDCNHQIWVANADGTNAVKVPIALNLGPAEIMEVRLSSSGRVYFTLRLNATSFKTSIYSCEIDGSDLKVVIDNGKYNYLGSIN